MNWVVGITLFLVSSGLVHGDFTSLERNRRSDEAELVEQSRSLERLNIYTEPSTLVLESIRAADVWTGRNVEYRATLLKNAYARFNTPGVPKQIVGTNLVFLTSLILAEVPKLSADKAILTMSGLWNTLASQAPGESTGDWETRRKLNLELWLKTAEVAAVQLNPELINSVPRNSVSPPPGSVLKDSGEDPAHEPNPLIREKYYELVFLNYKETQEINKAREISRSLPTFEARCESLAVALYSKPPFALVELQEILDRRVSDERSTNIMNAVYRALPRAVAAGIPRPIPHASKVRREPQSPLTSGGADLPAVARPSKVLDGVRQQQAAYPAQAETVGESSLKEAPAGVVAAAGEKPLWAWVGLGLVALAGGWVWVRSRG